MQNLRICFVFSVISAHRRVLRAKYRTWRIGSGLSVFVAKNIVEQSLKMNISRDGSAVLNDIPCVMAVLKFASLDRCSKRPWPINEKFGTWIIVGNAEILRAFVEENIRKIIVKKWISYGLSSEISSKVLRVRFIIGNPKIETSPDFALLLSTLSTPPKKKSVSTNIERNCRACAYRHSLI